jgi:hypothetical protein
MNDAVKAMSKIEAHWRAKRDASPKNGGGPGMRRRKSTDLNDGPPP